MVSAFSLDGLANSHPIKVPVNHPDEINEIFDSISYNKVTYNISHISGPALLVSIATTFNSIAVVQWLFGKQEIPKFNWTSESTTFRVTLIFWLQPRMSTIFMSV